MEKCVLSVVMPAYNEASVIKTNLFETIRVLDEFCYDFELIVVDDGSTDGTYEQIVSISEEDKRVVPVSTPLNAGKGDALKSGVNYTTGTYVAFLDSDLDLHPSQLKSFMDMMKERNADVVIGSKMHKDSKIDYPMQRRIISHIYFMFLRILFRLNIHDTQTGIKLFKGDLIRGVMKKILVKRFAYDVEVLVLCYRTGAKIIEHPIELEYKRQNALGRMGLMDLWCSGWDTLAFFYRLYILKYYDKAGSE